jgi:hypothetical protein
MQRSAESIRHGSGRRKSVDPHTRRTHDAGMSEGWRRELRVAFSRRAQPPWFRIAKWTALLALAFLFWRDRWFWWLLGALFGAALVLHLLYRHKTRRWSQPWGGWNDLDAGR